jgi:hypothetical protein
VALHRTSDGFDPVRAQPAVRLGSRHEERRTMGRELLARGTLACPRCDAPVAPGPGPLAPSSALACPYCRHEAAVRDFLSLGEPSRPARVDVRVVLRAGARRMRNGSARRVRGSGPG